MSTFLFKRKNIENVFKFGPSLKNTLYALLGLPYIFGLYRAEKSATVTRLERIERLKEWEEMRQEIGISSILNDLDNILLGEALDSNLLSPTQKYILCHKMIVRSKSK